MNRKIDARRRTEGALFALPVVTEKGNGNSARPLLKKHSVRDVLKTASPFTGPVNARVEEA